MVTKLETVLAGYCRELRGAYPDAKSVEVSAFDEAAPDVPSVSVTLRTSATFDYYGPTRFAVHRARAERAANYHCAFGSPGPAGRARMREAA